MVSDLTISHAAFHGPVSPRTSDANRRLMKMLELFLSGGKLIRQRSAIYHLPRVQDETIPSRDARSDIPVRRISPCRPGGIIRRMFLHIHGGGLVLLSERSEDLFLKVIADGIALMFVSVGYKLVPEHLVPPAPNDCYDVTEYLVDKAKESYGAELMFLDGESAGGHLCALAAPEMFGTWPNFRFKGAVLGYGGYNMSTRFPSQMNFKFPACPHARNALQAL